MKIKCEVDPATGRVTEQSSHYGPTVDGEVYCDSLIHGECYVSSGAVHAVPPAPSPAHTWDWPSKSWVLSLADAKDAKWAEVKAARDAREFGTFRWNGFDFDGDVQAQRRLNLAVLAAQAALMAGGSWTMDWTLFDNSTKTLSATDMIGVVEALGANIAAAHEAARAKRTLIEAATTVEQLDAI